MAREKSIKNYQNNNLNEEINFGKIAIRNAAKI